MDACIPLMVRKKTRVLIAHFWDPVGNRSSTVCVWGNGLVRVRASGSWITTCRLVMFKDGEKCILKNVHIHYD